MKNTFMDKLKDIGRLNFLGSEAKDEYKVPLMDLAFVPIGVFFYSIKKFLFFASLVAVFMTLLSSFTGFNLSCGLEEYRLNSDFKCSASSGVYVTFFLLRLLLIAAFARLWYKGAIMGENIGSKDIMAAPQQDLKIFLTLFAVILANMLPIVSFLVLYFRVPSPDWHYEICFFALMSLGFLFPFIALRFYSLPAFILDGKKIPSLPAVLRRTRGNSLKIILALFVMCILFLIIFVYLMVAAGNMIGHNILVMGVLFDFLYNLIILAFYAVFVNHCVMQRGLLFGIN